MLVTAMHADICVDVKLAHRSWNTPTLHVVSESVELSRELAVRQGLAGKGPSASQQSLTCLQWKL